jgi:hypothetical protein
MPWFAIGRNTAAGSMYVTGIKFERGLRPSPVPMTNTMTTAVSIKTIAATLTPADSTIFANAGAGAFTITLPSATAIAGRIYTIKKVDNGSNAVTIGTTSSQTIDSAATYVLLAANKYITVQSDGTNWYIIGNN